MNNKRRRLSSKLSSKATGAVRESMPELPDHIIYSILLKLPVKALLRFRSLSKHWLEIISSSSFENQHTRSVRRSTSSCNVIYSLRSCKFRKFVHVFRSCRISSVEYTRKFNQPVKLPFSHGPDFEYVLFMPVQYHSCNGLLCLAEMGFGVDDSFLSIWNPATGKVKKVAWPPLFDRVGTSYLCTFMGFGYEPSTGDYKIVFLLSANGHLLPEDVPQYGKWIAQVMSLKENTWRTIDLTTSPCVRNVLGFNIGCQMGSVAVNGDVYWIVPHSLTQYFWLLKFNLVEESFNFLPLPEETQVNDVKIQRKLATIGGLLYIFVWEDDLPSSIQWNPREKGEPCKIDIWMLQDHTTWCKVATIPTKEYGQEGHARSRQKLYPLGFNLNGHVVMVNWLDKSLVVYLPQENRFVKLAVKNIGISCTSFHFVQMETLVSP